MKKLTGIVLLGLFSLKMFAQIPTNQYFSKEVPLKANKEFQFLAFTSIRR